MVLNAQILPKCYVSEFYPDFNFGNVISFANRAGVVKCIPSWVGHLSPSTPALSCIFILF